MMHRKLWVTGEQSRLEAIELLTFPLEFGVRWEKS